MIRRASECSENVRFYAEQAPRHLDVLEFVANYATWVLSVMDSNLVAIYSDHPQRDEKLVIYSSPAGGVAGSMHIYDSSAQREKIVDIYSNLKVF